MKEEEKQRKFHEALVKMLYPPPSSPPPEQENDEEEEVSNLIEPLNGLPEEELENEESYPLPSSSNDNNVENGSTDQKLTRAQRKRLRTRKLKEATSQRRKIIGPLLPGSNGDIDRIHGGIEVINNVDGSVRQNAATIVSGEPASSSKKSKLKQRRKSKKMVVAKLASSSAESDMSNQNQGLQLGTDEE